MRVHVALLLPLLLLSACVDATLEVEPGQIDYGVVGVGLPALASVSLLNPGPAVDVSVQVQPASGPFSLVSDPAITLEAEGTATVVVRALMTAEGPVGGALTIAWEGGSFDVPLYATGAFDAVDADRDGVALPDDCDDADPAVHTGAPEVCDGLDNDCDGLVGPDEADADGDGARLCDDDCDDHDPAVFPGADEGCDGVDTDCDGALGAGEVDADGDGAQGCDGDCDDGDAAVHPGAEELCDGLDTDCVDGPAPDEEDADGDGFRGCEGDCDDLDPAAWPGAEELCDGLDSDCDGMPGEDEVDADADGLRLCEGDCDDADPLVGEPPTWYLDDDGDGFGDASTGAPSCDQPHGAVGDDTDCDDGDAAVFPGAVEVCDGLDTDCDGALPADEVDGDGDGVPFCAADCDDADPAVYPGASEACDGLDTDCAGGPGADEVDVDGDGARVCAGDCDDGDPAIFPGAVELCDGVDGDCDGATDETDVDGDGVRGCDGDCDDGEPTVFPGATEGCDGIDTDCDGALGPDEDDVDGDGVVLCAGDCDDGNPAVFPGALEGCDGLDTDCAGGPGADEVDADGDGARICEGDCDDGDPLLIGAEPTWADSDGDGFGDPATEAPTCGLPAGRVADATDCDDGDPAVNPGATEACDGLDGDCDGTVPSDEEDGDSDGARLCDGDCADGDPTVFPGAPEGCDGIDTDCDGAPAADELDGDGDGLSTCEGDCDDSDPGILGPLTWYEDLDGDGFGVAGTDRLSCVPLPSNASVDTDCDDGDPAVHPGALEACTGVDDDCDGLLGADEVDGDGDGWMVCEGDCADGDPALNPAAAEVCDGLDNDCDPSTIEDDSADADTWYQDLDGDGYGNDAATTTACDQPPSTASVGGDCDEAAPDTHPNAAEACDGVDTDCDGFLDSEAVCPCTVEQYGGHSYLFCEQDLDWGDAEDACEDQDSFTLVVVNDAAEQTWFGGIAAAIDSGEWWWIGYTDQGGEWWQEPDEAWEWVNGSPSTYTYWNGGQPDNWWGEDCAHIYGDTGRWNDLDCGDSIHYVCESGS